MVDRRPRKNIDPIQKKVPANPKYQGVESRVKTGRTTRDVEVLSNQAVAKRKGELFRRIRCATLAKLLNEVTNSESIYQLANEENKDFDDVASQYSMAYSEAPSMRSVVTVNTEALGINQDTEFLVLDLREEAEYEVFHIRDSLSFPAPNITRDRFLPEVHRIKNDPNKLIIVYAWDERPGVEATQKFAEKGYENVYLLSGGVEEFVKQFPHLVEGTLPEPPPKPKGMRSTGFSSKR